MAKEHRISYSDITLMISEAKRTCANQILPMKVSKKEVIGNDPAHVAMMESIIMYLNGKGLLTTMVRIDYDEK